MAWKGFYQESKLYCSYANKPLSKKIKWWFEYILRAAPRFYFYSLKDKIYGIIYKIQ